MRSMRDSTRSALAETLRNIWFVNLVISAISRWRAADSVLEPISLASGHSCLATGCQGTLHQLYREVFICQDCRSSYNEKGQKIESFVG